MTFPVSAKKKAERKSIIQGVSLGIAGALLAIGTFNFGANQNNGTYQALSIADNNQNKLSFVYYKKAPNLSNKTIYKPGKFTHVKVVKSNTKTLAYVYNKKNLVKKIKLDEA